MPRPVEMMIGCMCLLKTLVMHKGLLGLFAYTVKALVATMYMAINAQDWTSQVGGIWYTYWLWS